MLDIKDLYQQRVNNHANKFVKIILNTTEMQYILNTANNIVDAKRLESSYIKDNLSIVKRFINGLKGEMAVSKHLGIPIIDPDVGVSTDFDVPDIKGYRVGVKTVEYGNFPVIPKVNTYPQVICICHPTANNVIYICGLANVDMLNKYQFDDLILDNNLRAKGSKTGFWGFSELQEVSLETIEPYKLPEAKEEPNLETVE